MHASTEAGPIVGIDLGTTNSLVAVCDAAGPRVLVDAAGRALLPSGAPPRRNRTTDKIGRAHV